MVREQTELLTAWFRGRTTAFLKDQMPERLPILEEQLARVERLAKPADEEVAVCFLGTAGVGKSTLLNALVSNRQSVLPHGGVGSLTAQATVVRYSEQPYLRAMYFGPKVLQGYLLTLETWHLRAQKRAESEAAELAKGLDAVQVAQAEAALPPSGEGSTAEGAMSAIEACEQLVGLLIRGKPRSTGELPYLLDALRTVVGYPTRWGTTPTPEDQVRISRLRSAMQSSDRAGIHHEVAATPETLPAFLRELREHAAGFLAPIIKHLEVGWNSPLLKQGVVLVDLPGLGLVTSPEHERVTSQWIREKARAIVLVVNDRGVQKGEAELLRQSGFINNLMHDGDASSASPVALALVMTHVDGAATAAWHDDIETNGTATKSWLEYFQRSCETGHELLRATLRNELKTLATEGGEATRAAREAALARIEDSVRTYTVSALEYRLLHASGGDRPHIQADEESRIPELIAGIEALAIEHKQRCERAWQGALSSFRESVHTTLELIGALWQEQGAIAEREAAALRVELDEFLTPLLRELEVRQGGFREFLRNGIPTQIESRVAEATLMARNDITKYLRRLEGLHWATLRATVRHKGAWVSSTGKHVNLPNELTLRFEEPVAVVWSRNILSDLRKRTAVLGEDYVQLVGDVVSWARGQKARIQPRFVEALHESLVADTKGLSGVGREAVDELKKKVRIELSERLERQVRAKCEEFIRKKRDEGPGVKQRILQLFHEELAEDVTLIAQPVATKVLVDNYAEVQEEISQRFAAYKNPLQRARDEIVASHTDSARRRDGQRRGRVMEELGAVTKSMPKVPS